MDLEFIKLKYTVTKRGINGVKKTKDILKAVSGKFDSGQLSAIIGPSGAGKSSLLNALSGYRLAGVTGEILAGGLARKAREFHKRSCYLPQEDRLQPLLTAGELMALAAALKMPPGAARGATCAAVLASMGLAEHRGTRTELLSGGQKKRLSIALELVNNPPVFFLDEPTSGLDQVTSSNCVQLLKSLARQGRTVVCTIHQPSASIFEYFDHVYVLAQGLCVYQGAPSALVPLLSSIGFHCPRHHNPADFIIELTENSCNITMLCEKSNNGKVRQVTMKETKDHDIKMDKDPPEKFLEESSNYLFRNDHSFIHQRQNSYVSTKSQISNISSTMGWLKMKRLTTDSDVDFATSSFTQFKILLMRMLLQITRNSTAIWIQIIHHVLCGVLIGLCFYGTANDGNQMFNHLKFCIGVTIFFAYTQIMVPVLIYPQEVKLVKREYFNRWYGLTPYYAALTVSKLPLQILLNVLFCSLVYFMWGLPADLLRFVMFCTIGNFVSLVAEGVGLAIGSAFSITNGCAIGPLAIAPFLGLAIYGFDFAKNIPWFMNMLMKTSFIRCGVVAMVLTVFGFERKPLDCSDVYCHFSKPNVLLDYLDLGSSSVLLEILSMAGLLFLFRSLCYLNLRRRFAT